MLKIINRLPFWLSLIGLLLSIYDLGFNQPNHIQDLLHRIYLVTIGVGLASIAIRYVRINFKIKVLLIDLLLFIFLGAVLIDQLLIFGLFEAKIWIFIAVFIVFIREFSALSIQFSKDYLNPAQLFVFSFLLIIVVGTVLLSLPNATYSGIGLVDALFTSTSAVCVTGLIVVDTGSYFTLFGQIVILALIQLGGLGIMTFTSYFSYFFKGASSFENQLILKDLTNSEKIADVFSTLKKIILLTLTVEAIGAVFIFFTLDSQLFSSFTDRLFFSIFHTVSGFCNAGFSTLPNSLYQEGFRFNYPLHLIVAGLFIIGGIGFPIIFNFSRYIKYLIKRLFIRFSSREQSVHRPWVVNINSRIVLITTAILITAGTVIFYIFEYDNTLAEHEGIGKVVTAFFGAVTPRTAGFNTVDTSQLYFSTIMIVFLLMWVGASPGSTGGGIKTSTFAIGTLNFVSLAKGKDRIEVFRREISNQSIRRAFAIISLSLVAIGFSVFCIAIFEPNKELLPIAFECFSAYSTVGLSLGITADFSSASKLVIIATMFVGRVSMLTILMALVRKVRHLKYRYPTEEILIN